VAQSWHVWTITVVACNQNIHENLCDEAVNQPLLQMQSQQPTAQASFSISNKDNQKASRCIQFQEQQLFD